MTIYEEFNWLKQFIMDQMNVYILVQIIFTRRKSLLYTVKEKNNSPAVTAVDL